MADKVYDDEKGEKNYWEGSKQQLSPDELKQQEGDAEAAGQSTSGSQGLSNLAGAEKTNNNVDNPFNYRPGGGKSGFSFGSKGKGKGGSSSFLKKHRKKLILGGVAGGSLVPVLVIIFIILGALKIPHFAENVAAWQFAKVTNQYRKSVNAVMDEKTAFDVLDDADKVKVRGKYGKYSAFDNINRLRPNKVIGSLEASGRIKYNYEGSVLFGNRLRSITIAPGEDLAKTVTIDVPKTKFTDKLIHPFSSRAETIGRYNAISDALDEAMRAHDAKIPVVIRGAVTTDVIREMGGSLRGLIASKFLGATDRQAKILLQRELYDDVHDVNAGSSLTEEKLKQAAEEGKLAEEAAIADDEALGKSVDEGGGTPAAVDETVSKALGLSNSKTILETLAGVSETVLKALNPLYDVAMPVCTFYEGAKLTPDYIDTQQKQTTREALVVLSTADQQKTGTDSINEQAVGAMNWHMGDITESNAMKRAAGESVDTTGQTGQTSALGTFGKSIFTTLFGANNLLGGSIDGACGIFTNVWFGVGVGVANVAGFVLSAIASAPAGGFEGPAADAAAQASFRAFAFGAIKDYAYKQLLEMGAKGVVIQTGKTAAQVAASYYAGELAKEVVKARSGMTSNGLETGTAFLNNVDSGANQFSNETLRANYYARPLNNEEVIQQHSDNQAEIAYNIQHQSAYNRYLALANPNSLLTRSATTMTSLASRQTFANILNSLASIFNPTALVSKLFGSINGKVAMAASDKDTQDYGNVQFGYSAEEDKLMGQSSYQPLENARILDASGKENEINEKYGKCFTATMGTLLADDSKSIYRDEDTGNVTNEGDCSPLALGPHNKDYGDLVFRWRLKHNYDNTAKTMLDVQDATGTGA